MAKNTTNLGLYEKESTDGSDTFNIQTMLNDNWDKIDVDSKAKADALTNLAGEGRTAETVKGNADAINALAGEGNTTTVKAVDDALKSHLSDTSSHITSTERATWNAKQAALGYVPVQQGGGTGQLGNKVYIGWDGSKLKAQVDALDLGRLLTESDYNQLFQFANDGKTGIANAVTAKGVAASPSDTFAALATKIGQISTKVIYSNIDNITKKTKYVTKDRFYNVRASAGTIMDEYNSAGTLLRSITAVNHIHGGGKYNNAPCMIVINNSFSGHRAIYDLNNTLLFGFIAASGYDSFASDDTMAIMEDRILYDSYNNTVSNYHSAVLVDKAGTLLSIVQCGTTLTPLYPVLNALEQLVGYFENTNEFIIAGLNTLKKFDITQGVYGIFLNI